MIRAGLRILLAVFYAYAGYRHIVDPQPFLLITPFWVPQREAVILWTGVAEIAGALALLQPFLTRLRIAGGFGLALYALCVWPANINHMFMDMARPDGGWGFAYHIPRMIAQPLIIWLALWVSGAIDWPFRARKDAE
ncbi:DoxX family protein [Aurantiacibacter sediminis]|uniref:DoxX family protein n=1 Tax=Aurantiacibacter sediminis TaxID=2793064 RepID=A0ABS0N1Q8_9SPHN|nr:DoxX family protein [Aurantiacibacter sediminis]MBH5321891.1 DoxX family protein [Aurantiacibacter sediminis]